MENIPLEIEQKLENLPVIPFDMSEDFQKILFSDNYNDIFNFYKTNYLPDVLKAKPEIYQRVSLYLTLTNQAENFTEQTDQVLYRRPVPPIEEFLSNKFFMGYSNATLYPYWKEKLEEIFKTGSPIRKVIFSGCIGCLTKDTTIATLNGDKTIEELLDNYDNEWVLSYNTTTNTWEPDKIIDVFYTGNRDVYEITLDNDEKIRCTDNHQFLTRKNKWVSIKDGTLVPGLSMMPYYYREDKKGYVEVKDNKNETWNKRYKIVANWKTRCAKYLAIHHKNYNKKDDRPSNLCVLKWKQHLYFHAKKGGEQWRNYAKRVSGEEFKQYRSDISKKAYETYKNLPNFEELEKIRKRGIIRLCNDSEHQRKASYVVWHGKNSELNRKKASENFTKWNKGDIACKTSRESAKYMRLLLSKKSTEEMHIINLKRKLPAIKRFHGVDSEEYLYILNEIHSKEPWYDPALGAKENHKRKKLYNHKIKSVRYIGKEDVYDITTERNHNFALKSGIIAHNSGKSTVARKAFIYVLYRVLCLRYPRATFNIDEDATIANVVIATTLKQVYEVNLLPFVKLMETMPCFQRVLSQRSFENFDLNDQRCPIPFTLEKSSGTVYFPDNIILTSGSQATHFTGMNVVNSFCDEINDQGLETAIALLNTLDNRFASRFAGSDLVLQSVVSSARTTNSAMGEYIRHLPMDDPSILMLKPMLWSVKPDPNFIGDGSTFPVMVGNGSIPSKIITDPGELKAIEEGNYNPPTGCELIQVPTVYKSKFELQLDQSIQDIAGMTTSDNNSVFRDTTRLEDPNLNPEIYLEVDIRDNVEIIDMIPLEIYFEKGLDGNFYPKRNKKGNFYCHVDLAAGGEGNCDAALCILHKEWKINEITNQKETMFIVDLMLSINAKNKIDINAIQRFLVTLASDYNMFIHTISSDQWNGVIFQQSLESSGFFKKVANVSVDKKLEPYMNAARLIEMGLVKVGTCNKLKKELEALVLTKGKVTRTTEKKDMADVLVGSIYNAQLNYFDEPLTQYVTEIQVKNKTKIEDLIDTSRQKLVKL